MKTLYAVTLLFFVLVGCSSEFLTPEELTEYTAHDKNGFTKSISMGSVRADVTYRPTDLQVYQDAGDINLNVKDLERLRSSYGEHMYFTLSLSAKGKEALHQTHGDQYIDLVHVLSFRMNDFTSITTSKQDTIPVADFALNRTFGLASATDIIFVFDRQKIADTEWIQFNLNEFGLGIGNQRFRFETDKIKQEPQITFKTKG